MDSARQIAKYLLEGSQEVGKEAPKGLVNEDPPHLVKVYTDPHRRPFRRSYRKIGRNEQCPCGSGKKFKRCHQPLIGGDS